MQTNNADSTTNTNAKNTANNQDTESTQSVKLPASIAVDVSEIEAYQSGNIIHQGLLESSPSGNGDITSILKILPNVQFDTRQNSSSTPGEINPANISISGGLYYQNNFQIDGFNMNNDLDPAAGSYDNYNPVATTALPGQSQGLNIDTSLLESIQVQDSNISAAYGGFTGGVIEANTKRARKAFGGNISYSISQGNATPGRFSLTNYHIYGGASGNGLEQFLASDATGGHPQFIKHSIRASIESKFNDKSGIIASFNTTQSFIPLNAGASSYLSTTLDSMRKTQKRQNYNFFIKGHYDVLDNLTLEGSYAYMPSYSNYFIRNTKDSSFDMLTGGHQLGLKAIWENALGRFNAQSNLNLLDSSRVNSADHMLGWRASAEKNWTTNLASGTLSEGGYGNVRQKQTNFNIKATQVFTPLESGVVHHIFSAGVEYGYVNAKYHRAQDMFSMGSAFLSPLSAGQSCLEGDITCSSSPVYYQTGNWANNIGQYNNRGNFYKAGTIALNSHTLGGFIEDDIRLDFGSFGEINTRFGLRLDYDTYMSKATIAPRFSLNYIAPWSKDDFGKDFGTQLTLGANRYYGRNIFAYRLMDARSALQYSISRHGPNVAWEDIIDNAAYQGSGTICTSGDCWAQNKSDTDFKKIRVPYTDELSIGISQKLYAFSASLKYIYRQGKDEIRRMCQAPDGSLSSLNCTSNIYIADVLNTRDLRYVYTNYGQSESDVISLAIQNDSPIDTFGIKHFYLFAFDYTQVRRNFIDYSDNITQGELDNQFISWDGEIMRYGDRPATNFARPYTLRLTTTHSFSIWRAKFTWNNFFRWRSNYYAMASVSGNNRDRIDSDGDGVADTYVDTFRKFRVKGAFNWDMRLGFEINTWKSNTLYVNLDIINLLDSQNLMIASASYSASAGLTATPVYELGRQFWVQVGYRF